MNSFNIIWCMMCVIVLQWKCSLAISKWRKWKLGQRFTFLRFFDMTLQKNVKSRVFWIFKKKRKKRILELRKAIRTCSRFSYLHVRYLTNWVIKWSVSVSGFLALHRVGPVYGKIVLSMSMSSHSPSKFNCRQHDKVMLSTFHTTCYSAPVA